MSGRVLLLGGHGFIGSAVAPLLSAGGWQVCIAGREDDLEGSLAGCQAVVHLACSTTPGSSARNPLLEGENLAVTLRLLACLDARRDVHLVFISSGGSIYGNPAGLPVPEAAPPQPLSWHAAGKAAVEALLAGYRAGPLTILRVANAYGPAQPTKTGFGFIRALLDSAREGRPLEIWGDGGTVRDFVHVEDVGRAILAALVRPDRSGCYNVGSGVGHSLNQVVALARKVTGCSIETRHRLGRQTDVSAVVLDIGLARRELGWQPIIPLAEGIAGCWRETTCQVALGGA